MAQRVGQSSDGTFVMIVDEDKCHANYARDIVSRRNFHAIQKTMRTVSYEEKVLEGFEEDDDEEMGEVNSNEAKNVESVEVVSYEVGHGNAKISNFDATQGNVHKTSYELFNEKVSRVDGGSSSLGEQISYKIKIDAGVSMVSLVDYTDSEDE
uniref:Uncharacterized protein n=1 Tax=Leersia perrieri TaxID=77586 RepID=A0A0D9WE53_9ORYZ